MKWSRLSLLEKIKSLTWVHPPIHSWNWHRYVNGDTHVYRCDDTRLAISIHYSSTHHTTCGKSMARWDARTRQWWLQAPAWTAKSLCQIIRWKEKATVSLTSHFSLSLSVSLSLSLSVLCPWLMPSLTRPWLCHSVPRDSVSLNIFWLIDKLSDCHFNWTDGCCLLPWHVSSHMCFFSRSAMWWDVMRRSLGHKIAQSLTPWNHSQMVPVHDNGQRWKNCQLHQCTVMGSYPGSEPLSINECNVLQQKAIRNR